MRTARGVKGQEETLDFKMQAPTRLCACDRIWRNCSLQECENWYRDISIITQNRFQSFCSHT